MTETPTQPATQQLSATANRAELADCLAACALATKARSPHPALACVLITAGERELVFEATSLEFRVRRTAVQVQIDAPGVLLVDCEALLGWLRKLDCQTVTLGAALDTLDVTGDSGGHRKLFTQAADQFPKAPADEAEVARFVMPLAALWAAYRFVENAVAKESGRYAFNGVLFERDGNAGKRLCIVAMDGRRLAAIGVECSVSGDESNVILPDPLLSDALRALGEADENTEVTIGVGKGAARIESGYTVCWVNRLEGAFPPWRDTIPRDCAGKAVLDRESFIACCRRAADAATPELLKLRIEISGKGFAMSARSPERGDSSDNYPCRVGGEKITIAVNPQFLCEALGAMAGDEAEIHWDAPNRPMKITCGAMTEIIMPMNLQ